MDKPQLKALMSFKKNFISDYEIFYMANRGTIAEVQLTKDDFQKIGQLEESIPDPQKVIINGQLDEMKVSKGKLGLQTEQGFVNVFANDKAIIDNIVSFMGKEVKKSNSLSALKSISGLLKDEISDEQFTEMLKDIHR